MPSDASFRLRNKKFAHFLANLERHLVFLLLLLLVGMDMMICMATLMLRKTDQELEKIINI